MTYRREPGSVEAALQQAVNALNPDRLEAVTGKTRWAFEKAMNPFHPTQVSVKDAARIDAALYTDHGFTILAAALKSETRSHIAAMGSSNRSSVGIDIRLSMVMKEVGDIGGAYAKASKPDSPNGAGRTRQENSQIHKEVSEAITVLEQLKADIENELNNEKRPMAAAE